jgi:hypothetical protein
LAFASPDKRRGICIPADYRLLEPVDQLLRLLGMLSSQSTPHDDALHRLAISLFGEGVLYPSLRVGKERRKKGKKES